jgi:hypothetical protein
MNKEKLKVAIYAQVTPDSGSGGVESVLIGLISALSKLDDGSSEYIVITHPDNPDWLKPYMGSNFRVAYAPESTKARSCRADKLVRILNTCKIGPLYRYMHSLLIPPVPVPRWPEVPVSDGFYESLGWEVIHFPFQHFVLCALPAVFNPHDLQHLHFPRFFTPQTIAYREVMYPAGCRFAHTVAVGSNWVKQDVIDKYHISPNKVQVIPWAPPTQAYRQPSPEQLDRVKKTYSLDLPFALYPAITWEHKNHLRLLEALAMVRAKDGIKLSLVCTGGKYPGYWPKIEARNHRTSPAGIRPISRPGSAGGLAGALQACSIRHRAHPVRSGERTGVRGVAGRNTGCLLEYHLAAGTGRQCRPAV